MLNITYDEVLSNRDKLRTFTDSLDERQRELYLFDIIALDFHNKTFCKKLSDLVLKMDLVEELLHFFKPVHDEELGCDYLQFKYYRESGACGIIRINDEHTLSTAKLPWLRKLYKVVMGTI